MWRPRPSRSSSGKRTTGKLRYEGPPADSGATLDGRSPARACALVEPQVDAHGKWPKLNKHVTRGNSVEIQELFANVRVADDLTPALLRIYETIAEDETW